MKIYGVRDSWLVIRTQLSRLIQKTLQLKRIEVEFQVKPKEILRSQIKILVIKLIESK